MFNRISFVLMLEQTRQIPILIVVAPDDEQRLMRALDMGVNDYLIRPIDRQELMARVNTQIRRARYAEQLRISVQTSIEMAVTDALTGLYNRRYMETHLSHLVEHSINRGKPLSALAIDVDFFKPVNDTHGHDVGDKVLQELAGRIRENIRTGANPDPGEDGEDLRPSAEVFRWKKDCATVSGFTPPRENSMS